MSISKMKDVCTIPLSLQDMCVLNITFQWDKFPLPVLSDLPLGIRRNLISSLPLVDALNLEGTPISKGVDLDSKDIRESMFSSLFSHSGIEGHLCTRLCYTRDFFVDHIASCYPSLDPTVIKREYTSSFVFPSRALQYISITGKDSVSLIPSSVEPLLQHCKLMRTKHVELDCCCFADSVIWKDYLSQAGVCDHCSSPEGSTADENSDEEEYTCRAQSLKRRQEYQPSVDPACTLPSLQQFLSGIETLELGGNDTSDPDLDETVQAISYVIMHNIATSNQPSLKHLKIFGMPNATCWVLSGVSKLLCKSTCEHATTPYLLESIALLPCEPDNGYSYEYMLSGLASEIAVNLKAIIALQMKNLKSITVYCLGFHYEWLEEDSGRLSDRIMRRMRHQRRVNTQEYMQLLSLLFTFLKQPQMQSLDIDKCPSTVAYQLIEAFLCTSTSIEQQLTIQVIEESKEENDSDWEEEDEEEEQESTKADIRDVMQGVMPPISQPIPESSTRFKCLDMNMSSGRSIAWLLNLPELKLKSLKFCASYLPLVSPHIDVQVEHVTFDFFSTTGFLIPVILPNHLEKFITSNQALKSLEIVNPTGPSDRWRPDIYPALNHCLSTLSKQGRNLDEIHMKAVGFHFVNPKEFFTIVRDLSQQCGTTLVLTPTSDVCFSEEQVSSLLPALSKEFQGKKIKKIIVKRDPHTVYFNGYDPFAVISNQLQMIADEVIAG